MSEAHRLIVGARGWNHDGWNGTFYPEDLPQDWRLSYYANEFTGVLVPEPVWRAADPSIIGGWLGDVADGFLFYLEQHDPRASSQISFSHRKLFGSHWGVYLSAPRLYGLVKKSGIFVVCANVLMHSGSTREV